MTSFTKKYEFIDLIATCGNDFKTYHFHPIQEVWCQMGVFYIRLDRILQRPKGNMNVNSVCDTSDTDFYLQDFLENGKCTTIFNHVPVARYSPKYNTVEVLMMVETCLVNKDVECLDQIRSFIQTSLTDDVLRKRYRDDGDKKFEISHHLITPTHEANSSYIRMERDLALNLMHRHMEDSKVYRADGEKIEDVSGLSDCLQQDFYYEDAYDLTKKIKNAHKFFLADKNENVLIESDQNGSYRMAQLLNTYKQIDCQKCNQIVEKFPKYRSRVLSRTLCKKCTKKSLIEEGMDGK